MEPAYTRIAAPDRRAINNVSTQAYQKGRAQDSLLLHIEHRLESQVNMLRTILIIPIVVRHAGAVDRQERPRFSVHCHGQVGTEHLITFTIDEIRDVPLLVQRLNHASSTSLVRLSQ
jgi:hypothetical protein